jgi:VWFA-related protein
MSRLLFLTIICGLLIALQTPAQQTPVQQTPIPQTTPQLQAQGQEEEPLIKVTVDNVVAPVWVYDRNGSFIDGLRPDQFHLFDNNKEQNIQVDVSFVPISMVICIQANANVEKLLPTVSKIGNLMKPIILGDQGEAAVIAYDSRIRVLQDFTNDSDKLSQAVKKIYPGSTPVHLNDAVANATRMLRTRPTSRRRVVLVIGETRDVGSETRAREAAVNLQMSNVLFYAVDMSHFLSLMSAPPPEPRPDVIPPAAMTMPSGVPATPNTVMQTYGTEGARAEFVPMLVEIFKDAKAIFKTNPVTVYSKATGGEQFSYLGKRGLEDSIQKIGELLHAQYTISYRPNNKDEGGFHTIHVEVAANGARDVQTRPGYWLGAKAQ